MQSRVLLSKLYTCAVEIPVMHADCESDLDSYAPFTMMVLFGVFFSRDNPQGHSCLTVFYARWGVASC